MSRSLALFLALAVPVATVAGCGSVTDESPGRSFEAFQDALYDAYCSLAARCGVMPPSTPCKDMMRARGLPGGIAKRAPALAAGRARYNPEAGAAYLRLIDDAKCGSIKRDAVQRAERAVVEGTVRAGGTCKAGWECVAGTWCDAVCGPNESGIRCCTGTCRTRPPSATCSAGVCGAGSVCEETVTSTSSSNTITSVDGGTAVTISEEPTVACTDLLPLGAPCSTTAEVDQARQQRCDGGAECVLDQTGESGTCGRGPFEGEPCPAGTCWQLDNYCDEQTQHCQRRPGVGEPCASEGGSPMCLKGAYCVAGICHAPPSLGEDCTNPEASCWPATCGDSGRCEAPTPASAPADPCP